MIDSSTKNEQLKSQLQKCVNRDQAAFKALYDSTCGQLYATLIGILRIDAVAEEALQETYLKIWNKASEYRSELSQPMTWMTSIARYHALDILRKRASREARETTWDDVPIMDTELPLPGPAQILEHQDILEHCFSRLSDNQNQCIVRAYVEGLTHDELSESTNSPVGTVKSWIRRGLLDLKECIRELS